MKQQSETTNIVPGSDAPDLSRTDKIISSFKDLFQQRYLPNLDDLLTKLAKVIMNAAELN